MISQGAYFPRLVTPVTSRGYLTIRNVGSIKFTMAEIACDHGRRCYFRVCFPSVLAK